MDPVLLQVAIQTIGLVSQNQISIEPDFKPIISDLISSMNQHDASKLSECLSEQINWGDGDVIGDKHAFIKRMRGVWAKHVNYNVEILNIKYYKPENGTWIQIESQKQSNYNLKYFRLICVERYNIKDESGLNLNLTESNNLEIHLGIRNSKIENISLNVTPRSP